MQESMNRDGIGCSQNLVLDTTLDRIKLTDLGEMTDCRPENMRSFSVTIIQNQYVLTILSPSPYFFETDKTEVLQRGARRADHQPDFDDLAFQIW